MKWKEFRKAALAWMLAIAMVMPNSSMVVMAAETDVQNIADSTTEPQENEDEENRVEESAPPTEEGEDSQEPEATQESPDAQESTTQEEQESSGDINDPDPTPTFIPEENDTEDMPETKIENISDMELVRENQDENFEWNGNIITKYIGTDANVIIPERAERIGEEAFYYNSKLETVSFSGVNVRRIEQSAFEGCKSLRSIDFPEGLEEIGKSAFEGCNVLENFELPNGLEVIGVNAFWYCDKLTEVEIPATVTDLGANSFAFCDSLEKLTYGEGTKIIYGCAAQGVRTVVLPSTTEEIADDAFEAYSELRNINFPASLKKIGWNAFGFYGFSYVKRLEELRFEGDGNIEIATNAFNGGNNVEDVPVYCPYNSKVYQYFINKKGFKVVSNYTIRYELNGGQNVEENPQNYEDGQELVFYDPSRDGYEFKGWYTDKSLTKEFSYDKSSTKGNLVLYAKWEVIKYQLTYDLDGGALAKGKTNPTVYDAVKDVALNAPVKAGYNFTGWKVNEEETRITNNKITKGSHTGDLHLTACWKEYAYRVVWNKNAKDAAGSMSDVDLTFSEELTIPEEGYTRNGYDFLGWNTSANGKGTAYTEGMKVKGLSTKDKATVTLYAQWQERPFEILYELNGGVNSTKNPDSYSLNKTVSLQNPTREGFTFAGWYTDAGFADGTQIRKIEKNPGDITVYARWRENVYTIKLDGNGGKREDKKVMSPVNAAFTEEKVLPSNEYVRAGYRFEGWNTRKDGKGTAYADGETVSGLLAKDKAAVTLYAQWTIIEIPITYELDGGVNSAKNPAVVTIAKDVSLSAPTREGYTFKGWYTDSSCEVKVKNNKILKSTTQPVTVYAKWEENRYALKYDKNGGKYDIAKEAQNKSYGYTDSVTLLNGEGAERANYTLTGWNTKKDRSGTHYGLGAACSGLEQKGTVILYAEWTPRDDKTYKITYHNLEGAENRNPDSYSFEKDVKLANPVRTGYTFNGWYTDAAYESKKVASISRKETKDMELYAKWTENQYTIKYDGNKGSCPKGVKMVPVQTSYTHAVTLTDNAFVRKGYEFTGWNKKKDGTGVPYGDKDSVTGLSDKNKGTVTLYAQWQAVSYKVTYENMGEAADNSMNPDSYTVERDVTLKNPEWYGYTFKGWYSDSECKKKVAKISKNTAQPVTVYAKWEENEYSVRFALQGGEGNIKSLVNRKYTAEITIPNVKPEKEGKTFAGWSLSPNGSAQYQAGDKVSFRQIHEDGGTAKGIVKKYVTLYAIWQ